MSVFTRIMTGLAAEAPSLATLSIDATRLPAHRTVSRPGLKWGEEGRASDLVRQRRDEHQII